MQTHIAVLPMLVLLLLAILVVLVLIRLFSKRPSVAAVIVIAVLASVVVAYLLVGVSHRRVVPVYRNTYPEPPARSAGPNAAIWMPGIEDEFEANVYPSKLSAVRSLGLRIGEPIRQLFDSQQLPKKGIVFESNHDRSLLEEFVKTAFERLPQTQWTIEPETVAVEPNEVGVILDLSVSQAGGPSWNAGDVGEGNLVNRDWVSGITGGTYRARVLHHGNGRTSISADFVEKPWIENFYGNWNNRPNKRLIVAKSDGSCLTGQEAERQAILNACNQLTPLLRETSRAKTTPSLMRKVTPNDIRESGFIVDQFSQKFDGRAGEIWRHALLIDASPGKMEQFAMHKAVVTSRMRANWARMISSVLGLLVLIIVAYIFLNAATRGYYTWSLRIAGAILAVVVIILFIA
jgi:hypothetical protein